MSNEDIRWKQRFQNFEKALSRLEDAVKISESRKLNDLEEQGLIQRFEFTHELAWNVIKDYFEYQGNTAITGSRDATREAFSKGLIKEGGAWMEMIKSPNQSTHTSNDKIAKELKQKILNRYFSLFVVFKEKMQTL
ncbi:MAG: nucleotidyltransferase substrate binding protein [Bacteroidales bacterium]